VPLKICSSKLTTCRVAADGTIVVLEFLDQSGGPITLQFPLDQAEAIVMTLPHLLACAVVRRTGSDQARYVFNLDEWSIESAKDQDCLLTTLKTTNGFEVCFGMPFEACRTLGSTLQQNADQAAEAKKFGENTAAFCRVKLN
jgi:hypothetical protein